MTIYDLLKWDSIRANRKELESSRVPVHMIEARQVKQLYFREIKELIINLFKKGRG